MDKDQAPASLLDMQLTRVFEEHAVSPCLDPGEEALAVGLSPPVSPATTLTPPLATDLQWLMETLTQLQYDPSAREPS